MKCHVLDAIQGISPDCILNAIVVEASGTYGSLLDHSIPQCVLGNL